MKDIINNIVKLDLMQGLSSQNLEKVIFEYEFSHSMDGSGNCGTTGYTKNETVFVPYSDELYNKVHEYFLQVKDTPERFNKFIFELYADGTYKAEYLWDGEYILQQHLRTANIMPEWFFEKLTQRMEYWGYGDDWQTGQIVVWVKDNDVFCETYIIENGQKILVTQDIVTEFENYEFKSDILSYYEMTNFGILKDVWQRGKWNKFIIRCPEKDLKTGMRFLDLDKDVEYIWEE